MVGVCDAALPATALVDALRAATKAPRPELPFARGGGGVAVVLTIAGATATVGPRTPAVAVVIAEVTVAGAAAAVVAVVTVVAVVAVVAAVVGLVPAAGRPAGCPACDGGAA